MIRNESSARGCQTFVNEVAVGTIIADRPRDLTTQGSERLVSSTIQILLRPASFVLADYCRFARRPESIRSARSLPTHPNDAGYQAMADAIDLSLLK